MLLLFCFRKNLATIFTCFCVLDHNPAESGSHLECVDHEEKQVIF